MYTWYSCINRIIVTAVVSLCAYVEEFVESWISVGGRRIAVVDRIRLRPAFLRGP